MITDDSYQRSLDFIYGYVDYGQVRLGRQAMDKFDLGRMFTLMAALGDPHTKYPSLHVAGTKGKGSVAAMCASVFQVAGMRTGLYTSPHLSDFCERIQIDRQPISYQTLAELTDALRPHVDAIPGLTFFEITTAMALLHFACQKVDVAVIEVGLGGRLDATNVITPQVSVITSISLDHTAVLGDTLTQIAGEKAGIIKPGVPLVLAPQAEEADRVVSHTASERGAPLLRVADRLRYQVIGRDLFCQDFDLEMGDQPPIRLSIGLLGQHQIENAATAFAALQLWRIAGEPLPIPVIRAGLAVADWPCRFEILGHEPLLIVDSAHNSDSARRLRQTLDDFLPGREVVLIFGSSEDKDIAGMMAELLPGVRQVVFSRSTHPRAALPEDLAELAKPYSLPSLTAERAEDALPLALSLAGPDDVVLAAGSLFMAAAIRDVWRAS